MLQAKLVPDAMFFRGTWRVEDYCSFMAIRATNGETKKNHFELEIQDSFQLEQGPTILEWSFPSPCLRTLGASFLSPSPGFALSILNYIGCSWVAM